MTDQGAHDTRKMKWILGPESTDARIHLIEEIIPDTGASDRILT